MRKTAVGWLIAVAAVAAAGCSGTTGQSGPTSTTAATSSFASSSVSASVAPPLGEWSYSGDTGPANWDAVAPGCAQTPESTESPIDIETANVADGPAATVALHYAPAAFEVENNGHTIEAVPHDTRQNSITIDGTPYYLQQFHFHAVSEHQISGQNTDMELHLVHRSDAGELAVLGILLTSGATNEPLAELFTSIPAQENEDSPADLHQKIDLSALLPADDSLAQYQGSLTTPPCTQGVRWNVFLTPVTLSPEQIAANTAVYQNNSRPVQPLNGRTVVHVKATG